VYSIEQETVHAPARRLLRGFSVCILPINSTCSTQTGFNWAETASKAGQWRTQVALDVIRYFSGNFLLNVDFSL